MNKSKIIQMVVLLAAIVVIAAGLMRVARGNSMSLTDYEKLNAPPEAEAAAEGSPPESSGGSVPDAEATSGAADASGEIVSSQTTSESSPENLQNAGEAASAASLLTGAVLNGSSQLDARITYWEGFYYEPLSDNLRRYITGISYPAVQSAENGEESDSDTGASPEITLDELRYVHIWHYDFDGNPAEGELICNEYIAQDLVEIFYELYRSEYQLERVLLIDEYDGDDTASMEDNNTSCFNYRLVEGSTNLSKHAYGLAVDINPFYNPYITYDKDGTEKVSPAAAEGYADRSASFAYKIDENDLCYKLFIQHGFTWGGNWNSSKDYQHFQKAKP